jgi:hypothetical protein
MNPKGGMTEPMTGEQYRSYLNTIQNPPLQTAPAATPEQPQAAAPATGANLPIVNQPTIDDFVAEAVKYDQNKTIQAQKQYQDLAAAQAQLYGTDLAGRQLAQVYGTPAPGLQTSPTYTDPNLQAINQGLDAERQIGLNATDQASKDAVREALQKGGGWTGGAKDYVDRVNLQALQQFAPYASKAAADAAQQAEALKQQRLNQKFELALAGRLEGDVLDQTLIEMGIDPKGFKKEDLRADMIQGAIVDAISAGKDVDLSLLNRSFAVLGLAPIEQTEVATSPVFISRVFDTSEGDNELVSFMKSKGFIEKTNRKNGLKYIERNPNLFLNLYKSDPEFKAYIDKRYPGGVA